MNRTLLCLFGAIRTIEVTVESIVRNLVVPNHPCDVSVSLDRESLPATVMSRLQPYLVNVTKARPDCVARPCVPRSCSNMEARMRYQSVMYLKQNLERYTYAIVVRTDVMVTFPFRLHALYHMQGIGRFRHVAYRSARRMTSSEITRLWYRCAGNARMIPLVVDQPRLSPWCPEHIEKCDKNFSAMHMDVSRAQQNIIYNFGSSFLVMGDARLILKHAEENWLNWGKHVLQSGRDLCDTAETQLRLSAWELNLTLLDYFDMWEHTKTAYDIDAEYKNPVMLMRKWNTVY